MQRVGGGKSFAPARGVSYTGPVRAQPGRESGVEPVSILVIVPTRLAATRLPDKPLAHIGDLPMIVHVLRRAEAAGVGPVAVAAGDPEIVAVVRAAGGRAVLTDPALPSGTDRIRAALQALDPAGEVEAVLNLQGDMPFVTPEPLVACARLLAEEPACDIATAVAPGDAADAANPDVVKAVLERAPETGGRGAEALDFTRAAPAGPVWRHLGLYGYRRAALERFCAAPPSAREQAEKLEQLRAYDLGLRIWAARVKEAPISVDTPADLEAARAWWAEHGGG